MKLLAGNSNHPLANDIGEATNVAAQNPALVARLTAIADASHADLGRDGIGPGVRPLGRVTHPQPLIAADGTVRPAVAGAQKIFPCFSIRACRRQPAAPSSPPPRPPK